MTLGEPGDISYLCQCGWYEWCYFRQVKAQFPDPAEEIGRCLGLFNNEGNEMTQSLLQMNGRFVPSCSLCCLFPYKLDASNESEIRERAHFDENVTAKLVNSFLLPPKQTATTFNGSPIYGYCIHSLYTTFEDEIDSPITVPEADLIDVAGENINQQSVTYFLINAKIYLPQGERLSIGKVIPCAVEKNVAI